MGRKFQSNLEDRQQNSVVEEAFYIMRHYIYIYTNYWIDGQPWRLRLAEYISFNSVTLSRLLNSVCE